MKAIKTKIPGVLIIETDVFGDHRGYFSETYSKPKYAELGIDVEFVQDNMSFSAQKGTLRGLHWQNPPYAPVSYTHLGERKRIELAQVFLMKPDIVLFDEPTSNLDSDNKRFIIESIEKNFRNSIVILVSHDEKEYFRNFKLLELKGGRLNVYE